MKPCELSWYSTGIDQRVALLEVIGGSGGHVVLAVDDLFGQASTQCHTHAILQELLGVEAWPGFSVIPCDLMWMWNDVDAEMHRKCSSSIG